MKRIILTILAVSVWVFGLNGQVMDILTAPNEITRRALVIGISEYQDAAIRKNQAARPNAELMGAFLRTPEGGMIPAGHLHLLVDKQATMARMLSALEWIESECNPGDHLMLYFSGYAQMVQIEDKTKPYLFFYDSPKESAFAGAIPILQVVSMLQEISAGRSISFTCALDMYYETSNQAEKENWMVWSNLFRQASPETWSAEIVECKEQKSVKPISLTNRFIDGLLGPADQNKDLLVSIKEAIAYTQKNRSIRNGKSAFLIVQTNPQIAMSTVSGLHISPHTVEEAFPELPTLFERELNNREAQILATTDQETLALYQDFLLTIKLGQLMEPAGRNASEIFDSLLARPQLKSLHAHLRRELIAALLDETQQALNGYLRSDTYELRRRWKQISGYETYPKYMRRAIVLMEGNPLMLSLFKCKLYYFEGLVERLNLAQKKGDEARKGLQIALDKQKAALQEEPEASFVLNEIGVLYSLLAQPDSAITAFRSAISHAPRWGLPYYNMSRVYAQLMQRDSALFYAEVTAQLIPWNQDAANWLGNLYLQEKRYQDAEYILRKAAAIDPNDPDTYYNLACTKALSNDVQSALAWLEFALKKGFTDKAFLLQDPDLEAIRNTGAFQKLLDTYFAEPKD